MRVLSLFDGISCARVALDRAGLPVSEYLACEIDKHAIKVSTKNYPDIVHLGDVRTVHDVGAIDLLIGGSPCTDLSIAKNNREGLAGKHSSLFWEYARILNEVKPTYFILENVASMPKADKAIITETLGVEPVMINAALVSAQSRKRLFWTNIPQSGLPADRGILLKDILQPDAEVDQSMTTTSSLVATGAAIRGNIRTETADGVVYRDTVDVRQDEKANSLTTTFTNKLSLVKIGHIGLTDGQANRVYSPEGKSATLSANGGGSGAKTGLYMVQGITKPVVLNESPLQVLKEGRTELGKASRKQIREETGKDSTSRSAGHKAYFGREGIKANCLTTSLGAENLIVKDAVIRKLTPVECERLQGLPDGYTEGVAKTHRYKALGNGFNVDVIVHLLTGLPTDLRGGTPV
jgi:DNA-cytosine methyltransferase